RNFPTAKKIEIIEAAMVLLFWNGVMKYIENIEVIPER
ncbi:MAG: hypothetical protein K0R31_238, partial [Clostridiales bacterium]|nr:hypothetical protein [Clostridiales bacterium]